MMKKLRIAQVGTIWEKTPPDLYGGTERVVYNLTEELVRRGHDITLFATGDSRTSGTLKSVIPHPAYRQGIPWTNFLYPLEHLAQVFEQAASFDVIHVHMNTRADYAALVLSGFVDTPVLFTTHFVWPLPGDADKADRLRFLHKYRNRNFVTISEAQYTLPELNRVGVVHNGIDFASFPERRGESKYAVWLGRICNDKGTKEAIEAAAQAGVDIVLAGKLDALKKEDLDYYETEIKPLVDGEKVKYIGEVNDEQKADLFKDAIALLNPIKWNEPFGLVTVEAMAMGVPVIAFDKGPVRELIRDGEDGYIVANVAEMSRAIGRAGDLDRRAIRAGAKARFSVSGMADGYEALYAKVLNLT